MADKNIEIGIKTSGADNAATDIKKVGDAVEQTEKKAARARDEKGRFLKAGATATKEETASTKENTKATQENTTATQTATKAKQAFAGSSQKVSAASVNMRSAVQNVAFQFQDIAVQAEMGVGAVRIFSQQVPQLLGGFGPVGAVAGAVIGLGVPLAAALFGAGKAAEDATPKVDRLKEMLADFQEAAKEAADARNVEAVSKWFEALDAEEEQYSKLNEELARQLVLLSKIKDLKTGADSAEREARIAQIEADPNMSNADKIRAVSAIRDEEASARTEAEKDKLRQESAAAFLQATDASFKAGRQASDATEADRERARKERIAAAREVLAKDAINAGLQVPQLESQRDAARRKASLSINPETGETLPGYDEAVAEERRVQEQLDAARKKAAQAEALKAEADTAKKEAEKSRAEAMKQQEQAAAAARDAEKAQAEFAAVDQVTQEGLPQIERRSAAERSQRQARLAVQLRAENERAEREKLQNQIDTAESGLNLAAKREGVSLRDRGVRRGDRTMESIGRTLQDGTDLSELQKIANDARAAGEAGKTELAAILLDVVNRLEGQATAIESVKARLKNLRNPGIQ